MGISQEVSDIKRLMHIAQVLHEYGFGSILQDAGLGKLLPVHKRILSKKHPDEAPIRLRKVLEKLGGSFVKLGQLLSVRPDLVPPEFSLALSSLQDDVNPFSFYDVKRIVEKELGKPLKETYAAFDKKPLASASIGQVHKATLRNGTKVVVKVQRPRIQEDMRCDIDIMYFFAHHLEKKLAKYNPVDIVKEFELYSRDELNYMVEARNAEHIRKGLRTKDVIIPRVFFELTTKRVLTMEFINGVKLRSFIEKKGRRLSNKGIIQIGYEALFEQLFESGVFHADLHPGNILIYRNKLVFLDFGIVGRLDGPMRIMSVQMFKSLVDRDAALACDVLLRLGKVPREFDRGAFEREISEIIDEWHGMNLAQVPVTHMLHQMFNVCNEFNVRLPTNLVLVGKAVVTLEGTGRMLDPTFDFVEYSGPYLDRLMKSLSKDHLKKAMQDSKKIVESMMELPQTTSKFMRKVEAGGVRISINEKELKNLSIEIDRASNRLTYGAIIGAFVLAGAVAAEIQGVAKIYGISIIAWVCFVMAVFFTGMLINSILKEGKSWEI